MRPSFYPRLVNGPFDDPALFVSFLLENRAVIFDIGDIHSLSSRDILKISHVFVSHTHMDHFIGFDSLLRLCLGRDQNLHMFGPAGFLANVEGRLAGYSWNLVQNYPNRLRLFATEVGPERLLTREYRSSDRFLRSRTDFERPFDGVLLEEPALTVSAVVLDHGIPCLGFCIKERFHINIMKDRVSEIGLQIGPWLGEFKRALFNRLDPGSEFQVDRGPDGPGKKRFLLGDLAEKIALKTPGQKVAYVVDAAYTRSNVEKIVELADGADQLFIEAAFLEQDREIAAQKKHLTARQAGQIAGKARVKLFTPFHFSPRYTGREDLLRREATAAFEAEMQR